MSQKRQLDEGNEPQAKRLKSIPLSLSHVPHDALRTISLYCHLREKLSLRATCKAMDNMFSVEEQDVTIALMLQLKSLVDSKTFAAPVLEPETESVEEEGRDPKAEWLFSARKYFETKLTNGIWRTKGLPRPDFKKLEQLRNNNEENNPIQYPETAPTKQIEGVSDHFLAQAHEVLRNGFVEVEDLDYNEGQDGIAVSSVIRVKGKQGNPHFLFTQTLLRGLHTRSMIHEIAYRLELQVPDRDLALKLNVSDNRHPKEYTAEILCLIPGEEPVEYEYKKELFASVKDLCDVPSDWDLDQFLQFITMCGKCFYLPTTQSVAEFPRGLAYSLTTLLSVLKISEPKTDDCEFIIPEKPKMEQADQDMEKLLHRYQEKGLNLYREDFIQSYQTLVEKLLSLQCAIYSANNLAKRKESHLQKFKMGADHKTIELIGSLVTKAYGEMLDLEIGEYASETIGQSTLELKVKEERILVRVKSYYAASYSGDTEFFTKVYLLEDDKEYLIHNDSSSYYERVNQEKAENFVRKLGLEPNQMSSIAQLLAFHSGYGIVKKECNDERGITPSLFGPNYQSLDMRQNDILW